MYREIYSTMEDAAMWLKDMTKKQLTMGVLEARLLSDSKTGVEKLTI